LIDVLQRELDAARERETLLLQMLSQMQQQHQRLLDMPRSAPVVPQRERSAPATARHPTPQLLGTYDLQAAVQRIVALRQQGLSYEAIAAQLDAEGIPTRYGLPWQHSSVRYLFRTYGEASMED
jgi:hypothetical protein